MLIKIYLFIYIYYYYYYYYLPESPKMSASAQQRPTFVHQPQGPLGQTRPERQDAAAMTTQTVGTNCWLATAPITL